MFHRLPILTLLAATLATAAPTATRAADGAYANAQELDADQDYDRARDLRERGEINSLSDIMARLSGEHPGEIVSVALVRSRDRWVYRFKLLTADGKLQELSVDAKSMDVMQGEGGD